MSYDIDLLDPVTKEVIIFEEKHGYRGGTYVLGGTAEAHINVTYNYSPTFYKLFGDEKGIRHLYGKTGAELIPLLEKAIEGLKDDETDDYWQHTEGNAKRSLKALLHFAKQRPDGILDGD